MKNKRITVIHEYGTLCPEGYSANINGEQFLPTKSFENLWKFILENKTNDNVDNVMSIHTKKGRKYIKASKYVGTIQTEDGHIIEILPKIYKSSSQEEENVQVCRRVFLRMLSTYKQIESKSFQNANINSKANFPILERYIDNYLGEVQHLIEIGLKKNYVDTIENQNFLKGKLLFQQNLIKNNANRTKFFVEYNKYIEDIPQNKIIVTTLKKLSSISKDSRNITHCHQLLTMLGDITPSNNIALDVQRSLNTNRLFESYTNIIKWSEQFLLNNGFTAFSGPYVNISLLFSAERLFEYFIASLFKKYAKDYVVHSQSSKYFLVDRQGERSNGRFKLRPDIVIESRNKNINMPYDSVIIDTKWKNIDSQRSDQNYFIDIKDMYQLYAYGQKYEQGDNYFLEAVPKLVLIYPFTEKFTEKLEPFEYEKIKKNYGLKLIVHPFNLADEGIKGEGYRKQVFDILKSTEDLETVDNPTIFGKHTDTIDSEIIKKQVLEEQCRYLLFGLYESDEELYEVKLSSSYEIPMALFDGKIPNKVVLCNKHNISEKHVFMVNHSRIRFSKSQNGEDVVQYTLGDEVYNLSNITINIENIFNQLNDTDKRTMFIAY